MERLEVKVDLVGVMETHLLQLLPKVQTVDVRQIQMLRQVVAVEQSMQVVLVDQEVILVEQVVMEQQQVLQDLRLQELVVAVEETEDFLDLVVAVALDLVVEAKEAVQTKLLHLEL